MLRTKTTPLEVSGPPRDAIVYNVITGTENGDTLDGTAGDDHILGLGGSDGITGGGGNDWIEGGSGVNSLEGEAGNDVIYGGDETDFLDGGAGSDIVHGGGGRDLIESYDGGGDQLYSEDGDDFIDVNYASQAVTGDTLADGGAGNDDIFVTAWSGSNAPHLQVYGGDGGDIIYASGGSTLLIDAGAGNDYVTAFRPTNAAVNYTITLGAGSDLIVGMFNTTLGSVVVTDFQAGDGGDAMLLENILVGQLIGWNAATNPFALGYLRLVQSGADTLLQMDLNGATAGASFATYLVLQNVTAASLTARNLGGYAADGSVAPGQTIAGTAEVDSLSGTMSADTITGGDGVDYLFGGGGDDVIDGGEGWDRIYGGLGNDVLHGEGGNDLLEGGFSGNDQLFGGDGTDQVYVSRGNVAGASSSIMDGGAGNDRMVFVATIAGQSADIKGGDGNDYIEVRGGAAVAIDAGDGNDNVTIDAPDTLFDIALGAGADKIVFFSESVGGAFSITVSDFAVGAGGDKFDLNSFLASYATGWSAAGSPNPFSSGYLRLVQSGADTILQVDRDGAANGASWLSMVTLENLDRQTFTADNFNGFAPNLGNGAPALSLASGTTAYSESVNTAPAATVVASAIIVTDPENLALASATVAITGGFHASQDSLALAAGSFGNIAASYDAATGILSLTSDGATATVPQWQSALRSVTYANSSQEPDMTTRTLSFSTSDGLLTSNVATRNLSVTARNDSPAGADSAAGMSQDGTFTFATGHFGFSDVDGDGLSGVRITQAPAGGKLYFDADGAGGNAPVQVTTFPSATYAAADIAAGKLSFVPTAGLTGAGAASLKFVVADDGGTASGGNNTDPTANTLAFDITPAGPASIAGTAGDDVIDGTPGDDTINGLGGDDTLSGLGGNDTLNGGDDDDLLFGGEGNDQLDGGNGADIVYGDGGNDTLVTSIGPRDDLHGGDGDDHFLVSRQAYMWGDAGTDTFTIFGSGHQSRILDFQVGAAGDRLDLASFADTNTSWNGIGNPFALGYLTLSQVGGDVFIGFDSDGGGDHSVPFLYLIGVDLADLEAVNFVGTPAILEQNDTPGADTLTGTAALDVFHLGAGDDSVAGGFGVDTAAYAGGMAGYSISFIDGAWIVTDIDSGNGDDGVDTLHDVEELRFADGSLHLEPAVPLSDFNPAEAYAQSGGGAVAAGPSGTFVTAWLNSGQVLYQLYGQDGVAIGAPADAFGVPATGSLAVDYFSYDGFVIVGEQLNGLAPLARLFAADGTPQGPAFVVAGAQNPYDFRVEVLPDDSFMVAWESGPSNDRNIFARHFAADGTALADVVDLGDYGSGQRAFDLVALEGGGFFVARLAGGAVSGQAYDVDGSLVGSAVQFNSTAAGAFGGVSVDRLADGRLIVVYSEDTSIAGRIFDPADASLGAEIPISSNDFGPRMADVAALDDGGFVVLWEDSGFNGRQTYAQRFDADAARIGNQATVSTGDAQTAPSVDALPGGSWVAVWQDSEGFTGHIGAARFGPPGIVGTDGDDTINGGAASDTISAGGGDDRIDGGDGTDILYGGTGSDRYILGDGNDGIVEGAGQGLDGVETALLFYRLVGNVENLSGTFAGTGPAQTLYGNGLNNHILGSGANDVLWGNDGDDLLVGGSGIDILTGGSGRDILVGGTIVAANLLANGGFETQDGSNDARAYILAAPADEGGILTRTAGSLSGWQRATGPDFELDTAGSNALFNLGDGNAALAMTTAGVNQHIFQDVAGVAAGTVLLLSFAIARDAGAPAGAASTAVLEIVWNGAVVGTFTAGTAMAQQSILVTAAAAGTGDGGANRVEFREIGDPDDYGTLLDSVSLNVVADDGESDFVSYDSEIDGGPGAVLVNLSDHAAVLDGVTVAAGEARDTHGDFDVLTGIESVAAASGGSNWVLGSAGANLIYGGSGNDHLDGGGGTDLMVGNDGDDVYIVDSLDDSAFEYADSGTDEIRTGLAAYNLAGLEVENLTGLGGGGQTLTGNGAVNVIDGGAGDDVLDGGLGGDTLIGGSGDDVFIVDDQGDTIVEAVGGGNDRVRAAISYVLAAGAEVETLETADAAGTAAIGLTGNGFAQVLTGNAGANLIDGGGGADAMAGGNGNDIYVVDNAGDTVTENAGEGIDEIRTGLASYVLGANLEKLTGFSASGQTLTGNGLDNIISGGAGNDALIGGAGADTMSGGAGNDTYYVDNALDRVIELAGQGRDVVYASVDYTLTGGQEIEILSAISQAATNPLQLIGNGLRQEIYGNDGANFIDGGGGADYLAGFSGSDTYIVHHGSDVIVEAGGGGRDVVYSFVDYRLTAGQEIEVLSTISQAATTPLQLIGNEFRQEMYGNEGANFIDGGTGDEDYMAGFGGNDTYIVDHGSDYIAEALGGGRDVVYSKVSYTLTPGAEVEVLSVISQGAGVVIDLTGNELVNELYGNTEANFLDGGGGADYLQGFAGNDSYVVETQGDVVVEGAGEGSHDVVYARASYTLAAGVAVEVLSAISQGGTTAIDLTGNNLANELYGNAGANVLNGGLGGDYLMGYGGADTFAFTTALGAGNVDQLADFVSGTDRIALDDAIFTGLAPGVLGANAFVTGSQAQDADDRIVYNSATGQLFFDADGNGAGAAMLFAALDGHPPLAASDFIVI